MRRTLSSLSVVLKTTGGGKEAMHALKLKPTKYTSMQTTTKSFDKAVLLLNVGMTASLIGMSCSDMLQLRSLSLAGSLCGMVFNFTRKPPMTAPLIWGGAFAALNLYHIVSIVRERMPSDFTFEEQTVHDLFFTKVGLRPREFQKIHHLCSHTVLKEGDVLCEQGAVNDNVHFVINGSVEILIDDEHKGIIAGGSRGAVIGEITFLVCVRQQQQKAPLKNKRPAIVVQEDGSQQVEIVVEESCSSEDIKVPTVFVSSATITAREPTSVATFPTSKLQELFRKRPDLLAAWNSVCSDAVVSKLFLRNDMSAQRDRLAWYQDVCSVVLASKELAVLEPRQKKVVEDVRHRLHITQQEHAMVLELCGWTPDEWRQGTKVVQDSNMFDRIRVFVFGKE
jgi:CRP-like cAMP-binding protein